MPLGPPLRRDFYARDSRAVARDLIGCRLVRRLDSGVRLVVRLVEVEAYLGDGSDAASHAHRGRTDRNRTMFGPPGRLYVYRSYGIHTCVNVVCAVPSGAAAVLLRAAEPIEGTVEMRRHRGLTADTSLLDIARGPGRLAEALGLALADDGRSLLRGPLTIHPPDEAETSIDVAMGPRVGITKAAELPYRYFESGSRWISSFRPGKSHAKQRLAATPR